MKRNVRPCRPLLGLLTLLCTAPLLLDAAAARADDPPVDAFLCAAARRSPGSARPPALHGVAIRDQLSSARASVNPADRLCTPVGLDGAAPADPETHLLRHGIRIADRVPRFAGVVVDDALGTHTFDLARPRHLLSPTLVDATTPPGPPPFESHALDRYRCYPARQAAGGPKAPPAGETVEVTLPSGSTRTVEVLRPRAVCAPADVAVDAAKSPRRHLACYDVRAAGGAGERVRGLDADDGFGATTLDTRQPKELCLPARAVHACNGAPELCDRRFDEVAYATTHNAMSNAQDGFAGPNQRYSVTRQLGDGIRGLMLDTHYLSGAVLLCHSLCVLGQRPLVATLEEIRAFLERNPYEVATIIFESYVSAADTEAAFAAAGLLPYVHAQPVAAPWPTLREMIDADRRLVVFTDSGGGTYPWYHHVWSYAFETHYSFANPAALSCTPNRGSPSNRLFILNHFLTQVFGSPALAELINHDPLFIDRARQCEAENAALPNFVTVDFHDIGDVLRVVRALNGL